MKKDTLGNVHIAAKIKELTEKGSLNTHGCSHISTIQDVTPSADGCKKCLQMGDSWVTLRLCLTCGHVGCCDSSKNKHASSHFHETSHPIMLSYEPGEDWMWCYVDEVMINP